MIFSALAASMSDFTLQLIEINTAMSNSIVLANWKLSALKRLKEHMRKGDTLQDYSSLLMIKIMVGNKIYGCDKNVATNLWRDL
jgi:hypothetical protein